MPLTYLLKIVLQNFTIIFIYLGFKNKITLLHVPVNLVNKVLSKYQSETGGLPNILIIKVVDRVLFLQRLLI